MVVLISPYAAERPVLVLARWIASLNAAHLREHAIENVLWDGDGELSSGAGYAFFGEADGVFPHDAWGYSLAPQLEPRVSGAWLHVFACHGTHYREWAVDRGATRYFAYNRSLSPNWRPETTPAALAPLVHEVLTSVTYSLARGEGGAELLDRLRTAVERVDVWTELNPDEAGAGGTARQFCDLLLDYLISPELPTRAPPRIRPLGRTPAR